MLSSDQGYIEEYRRLSRDASYDCIGEKGRMCRWSSQRHSGLVQRQRTLKSTRCQCRCPLWKQARKPKVQLLLSCPSDACSLEHRPRQPGAAFPRDHCCASLASHTELMLHLLTKRRFQRLWLKALCPVQKLLRQTRSQAHSPLQMARMTNQ